VFRLTFGDRLFYDWLVSIGVTPRKTLTIGKVEVPDDLFRDFLRGHLDGDGSISHYIDRYHTRLKPQYVYERLYLRFLTANAKHIQWLRDTANRVLGVAGSVTVSRPRAELGGTVPMHTLAFAKREAIGLLRQRYHAPDVPCLARKRAIAEAFLTPEHEKLRLPI
jgi:hypothetical protein